MAPRTRVERLKDGCGSFEHLRQSAQPPVFVVNHAPVPALVVGNVFGGAAGEQYGGRPRPGQPGPAARRLRGSRHARLPSAGDRGRVARHRAADGHSSPDLIPDFEYAHPAAARARAGQPICRVPSGPAAGPGRDGAAGREAAPQPAPVMVADIRARHAGRASLTGPCWLRDARILEPADALGLSRYNRRPVRAPGAATRILRTGCCATLLEHGIRALIPTEALLLALAPAHRGVPRLAAAAPAGPGGVSLSVQMRRTHELCGGAGRRCGTPQPPSVIYDAGRTPLAADLVLDAPYWIKADAAHAHGATRGLVRRADSIDAALHAVSEAQRTRASGQGHARAPQQAGVNVLVVDGDPVLESMMLSLHDNPHTGGTSGLRRSWWHQAMRDDALARVRHLGWQGIAMLEYKWDPVSDAFEFIEINSRFWAALPRPVRRCRLSQTADRAPPRGRSGPAARGATGLTSRWTLPTDWGHMLSKVRDTHLSPLTRGRRCSFARPVPAPGRQGRPRVPWRLGTLFPAVATVSRRFAATALIVRPRVSGRSPPVPAGSRAGRLAPHRRVPGDARPSRENAAVPWHPFPRSSGHVGSWWRSSPPARAATPSDANGIRRSDNRNASTSCR